MKDAKHSIDSIRTYLLIYIALMVLLIATVIAGTIDMGIWNAVIALFIAVVKALLVVLFFMHVRHSSRQTWIFAGASFLWLALLLIGTTSDYATRPEPIPNSGAQQRIPQEKSRTDIQDIFQPAVVLPISSSTTPVIKLKSPSDARKT
jgi:cytochrome c oxidase subunit 4